jgi:hypothetical protein
MFFLVFVNLNLALLSTFLVTVCLWIGFLVLRRLNHITLRVKKCAVNLVASFALHVFETDLWMKLKALLVFAASFLEAKLDKFLAFFWMPALAL